MSIRTHIVAGIVAAAAMQTGGSGPAQAANFALRIASGHTESWHFVQITRDFFIPEVTSRVAERTDHTVNFIEGWGGTFVTATEVFEGVQGGIVDFGVLCYCLEAGSLPMQNFPYLLPFGPSDSAISVAATRRVFDQFPQLASQFEEDFGQRLLTLMPLDNYDIISSFPIESPEDIARRRIGGAGPNLSWVETSGALPVTALGADHYTSLQTGVFDGLIAFASIMNALNLYEVAPYYVRVGFGSMSAMALHANANTLDRLPPEVTGIIHEVATEMEGMVGQFTNEIHARQLGAIEENGGTVIEISDEVRAAWSELLRDLPSRSLGGAATRGDTDMRSLLEAYIAATEAEGYVWPVRYAFD